METHRVLLIEDDQTDAEELIVELERSGLLIAEKARVDTEEALRTALETPWDVVICDYVLPDFGWQNALHLCAEHAPETPFIVVSGQRGEEYAVEAMRAGAQDYVSKQKLMRLGPAVQRELNIAKDRKRAAEMQAEMASELQRVRRLEATGKLAGGLAHNLNNALAGIVGHLDLAQRTDDLATARKLIDTALHACESATRVVRQLNQLDKEPVIELEYCDMPQLLDTVVGLMHGALPPEISLELRCDDNVGPLACDPLAIEQILINLILNARDAIIGEGKIVCTVAASADTWTISVADDGIGVAPESQERIFEAFYTTKPRTGIGMGLSSVRQFVDMLGGQITLDSAPGKGSTFLITLPTRHLEVPSATPDTHGASVLIVHQTEGVRIALQSLLQRNGFTCTAMSELPEKPRRYDVILAELKDTLSALEDWIGKQVHTPLVFALTHAGYAIKPNSTLTVLREEPQNHRRIVETVKNSIKPKNSN